MCCYHGRYHVRRRPRPGPRPRRVGAHCELYLEPAPTCLPNQWPVAKDTRGTASQSPTPTAVETREHEQARCIPGDIRAADDFGRPPSGLVPEPVDRCGTTIGVQAGGVHGHPDGAKALRAAVDAVAEGRDIEAAADETPELATALQK